MKFYRLRFFDPDFGEFNQESQQWEMDYYFRSIDNLYRFLEKVVLQEFDEARAKDVMSFIKENLFFEDFCSIDAIYFNG